MNIEFNRDTYNKIIIQYGSLKKYCERCFPSWGNDIFISVRSK